MNLDKYKWRLRLLVVITPSYKDKRYIFCRKKYQEHIKEFHKRHVKMVTYRKKTEIFRKHLVGFDGEIKHIYDKLNVTTIFKAIDKMPLAKLMKQYPHIKPTNL